MVETTADPTLEALVPRGSARRNAVLVVLGLALLVAAWFLPRLQPGIGGSPGASWRWFADERQVLLVTAVQPSTWGGVEVRSVGGVSGAHVVDAWVVDADWMGGEDAPPAVTGRPVDGMSAHDAVAALGLRDDERLPHRVAGDGAATLVVLWQVDEGCAELSDDPPTVVVANRAGFSRTDVLQLSPFASYLDNPDVDGPCHG